MTGPGMEIEEEMNKINYDCPFCGEQALVEGPKDGTCALWCDICSWEVRGVSTGGEFTLFDIDHTDPWASVTPELKEVSFD